MLIGIDASQAAKEKKTGVENFSYEMIYSLLLNDKVNQYILYSDAPIAFPLKFSNLRILISPAQRFWHNLKLPKLINSTKPNIFISPGYMIPISSTSKMIAIVHDFAYMYFPNAYTRKEKFLQKLSINRAVSKSSAIIAMSKNTLSDLNKYYPGYRGIKEVVYQGYNSERFNALSTKENYRPVNEKYILSVGRLEERKNTKNLIKAYGILRHKYPEIQHKLVLSGKKGFRFNDIEREIRNLKEFSKDVTLIGFVPENNIGDLYKNADLFVYPSLYEGFGIPILESFAVGTPVACSETSSLPEVGGKGAEYFNPLDPNDIAEHIYKVISSTDLRKSLLSKARDQLKKFSWTSTAVELLKIIEKVKNEK